tara:strand:- start:11710 stop:12003 length:294 start_codon:yes stop_codon:yes gene_type:complete
MSRIDREQVKKVAELARINLNEHEINDHAIQLEKILDYIDQLQKIDTEGVICTTRAIEVINVLRSDENIEYENKGEIIELAPSKEGDFFKVPKIIKD